MPEETKLYTLFKSAASHISCINDLTCKIRAYNDLPGMLICIKAVCIYS
jgi:hypothetical protein